MSVKLASEMDENQKQMTSVAPRQEGVWGVALVGSGPASLTAAIYTTRGAASTIILGGEKWGGQLMLTTEIDNFPAHKGIQGPDLMQKMREHAESFGAKFIQKNVESVDFSKTPFELTVDGQKYLSKTVILATGAETRWLGVPGEDKLRGRGVSSCAPCDAPFFKNKNVVVIGGGDSAMEEALVLVKYATSVTLVHRKDSFRASAAMQKKVLANPKIKVIWNTSVVEFKGDPSAGSGQGQKLGKIVLKDMKTNKTSEVIMDGAFVAIGHIPSTKIFQGGGLELDQKGYIVTHNNTKTNIPGVFVAGDVHDYHYKQAITAAGFGCMAGMDAVRYLDEMKQEESGKTS